MMDACARDKAFIPTPSILSSPLDITMMTEPNTISANVISSFIHDTLERSVWQNSFSPNECQFDHLNFQAANSTTWSDILVGKNCTGSNCMNTQESSHSLLDRSSSPDEDILWQAVLDKNALASDAFVYCVKTTKIYCRSTCASRRPKRDNVCFANSFQQAQQMGYRPCKRCNPDAKNDPFAVKRQKMVLEIQQKLITPRSDQSTISISQSKRQNRRKGAEMNVKTIASQMGISVWHLHKVFKRETGVTPEQWLSKKGKK